MKRACLAALLFLLARAPSRSQQAAANAPQEIFDRAVADFRQGRAAESARGFDELARMAPSLAPQLWQRGIALYYAGRYKDCRAQFELHRTVNPNDVENAVWHFLCVARDESPQKAKAAMLPVGPDERVPMSQVAEMFRGNIKPEAVLAAAGGTRSSGDRKSTRLNSSHVSESRMPSSA